MRDERLLARYTGNYELCVRVQHKPELKASHQEQLDFEFRSISEAGFSLSLMHKCGLFGCDSTCRDRLFGMDADVDQLAQNLATMANAMEVSAYELHRAAGGFLRRTQGRIVNSCACIVLTAMLDLLPVSSPRPAGEPEVDCGHPRYPRTCR